MRYLPRTIRAQILTVIAAIMLPLVVALIWMTLYFAEDRMYDLGERDANARIESVAARAGFAVIVGTDNPDIAQTLVAETRGNGILAVELKNDRGHSLATLEDHPGLLASCGLSLPRDKAPLQTMSRRSEHMWCISAPVFERPNSSACHSANCIIGYLYVVVSAAPVATVLHHLVQAILTAGIFLLGIAVIGLWKLSATISTPLRHIASVMRRFAGGERTVRASEYGPDEVRTISNAYNTLIDAQEEQARTLELTVEQRTLELREATLAAQDAEKYKTTFMAQISHDMRTPLHVIQAQASEVINELEFSGDVNKARDRLQIIMQESEELAHRVTQVLVLTRGEVSRDPTHITRVALDALRNRVLDKAESLAQVQHNTLIMQGDSGGVWTDAEKVLQIITNLIENACKFTRAGTIELDLRVHGEELYIGVSDTGVGIPAQQLPFIWSDFRQVQHRDGSYPEGFGLGLAIVRQYATMLGGRYGARSDEGHGTKVWVTLPIKAPEEATL